MCIVESQSEWSIFCPPLRGVDSAGSLSFFRSGKLQPNRHDSTCSFLLLGFGALVLSLVLGAIAVLAIYINNQSLLLF